MLVTYNGIKFDYLNPTAEMINIVDIVRSLARMSRFAGHSTRRYTVAEHSILCAIMAKKLGYSTREQLLTLVHDFTEAYCIDLPAPLKKLLPEYQKIEAKVEQAIYEYLGVEPPTEEEHLKVKRIDLTMLVIEMRDLTVHEWESFINEHTYTEMLETEDSLFHLRHEEPSEENLRELFWESFDIILQKYCEEEANEV